MSGFTGIFRSLNFTPRDRGMRTRLFLNDANTIFAIDACGPDIGAGNRLLRPLLRGALVAPEAVQALLQTYGGTWVTNRGIKRYPRRESLRSSSELERRVAELAATRQRAST